MVEMRLFIIFTLVVALIMTSGCIELEVREEIKPDGLSRIIMQVDMSAFEEQMNASGAEDTGQSKGLCDNEQAPEGWEIISCKEEDGVSTLVGEYNRIGDGSLSIDGDTYRLDVVKAIEVMNQQNDEDSDAAQMDMDSLQDEEAVQQIKQMGVVYNYYVTMPGKVTGQLGGVEQEDGSILFDVLDLPEGAYAESSTGGFGLDKNLIMLVAFNIVVLGLVAVLVIKNRS